MTDYNAANQDLNYMVDPLGRVRFFGIYSAKVVDNKDPLNKGRVTLQILQPTGTATTGWAPACLGAMSQTGFPYGTFSTSSNQTVSAANTATVVNSSFIAQDTNKMSISNGKISVQETGDYFIMFSAIFTKSNANSTTADLWLRKNGVNIPDTNTRVTISGGGGETVMTANFILDLNAKDYIEFVFSSPDAATKLTYYAASSNPTRPAVPGIIATVNLVGKFIPQPGTKVWAMFEAGDPEYPVWIGVQ
jgi:hypothetical protein